MSYRDVILAGVRAAVAIVHPEMPPGAVQWDDAPQILGPAHVTLRIVSDEDEDPAPAEVRAEIDELNLETTIVQRSLVHVDINCESTIAASMNAGGDVPGNVYTLVRNLRGALYRAQECKRILRGRGSPNPCVVVQGNAKIYGRTFERDGASISMASVEVIFRAFTVNFKDPTPTGRIVSIIAAGKTTAGSEEIQTTTEVP